MREADSRKVGLCARQREAWLHEDRAAPLRGRGVPQNIDQRFLTSVRIPAR